MVTRRFWPHNGFDSAAALLALASGLHRQGVSVEVLAPRYTSSWPDEFALREITIHRPAAAPRSEWSMGRYTRHISQWLKSNAASYDLIYVDASREEAAAAVEATRGTCVASLLRVAGWGPVSDAIWWDASRSGQRCLAAVKQCDGVIAKCGADHRALLARGVTAAKVHRIDNGFASGHARSTTARAIARRVLADVNADLATDLQSPVILCIGRMTPGSGLETVAQGVRTMVARFPDLRVWFIGDGPEREAIYGRLRSDGVRAAISMPGTFLDTDDLLAAADVFLQADDEGLDHFLPAAVSAELPIIAARSDAIQTVLRGTAAGGPSVTWFEAGESKSLCQAVRRVIEHLPECRAEATALRRELLRQRPQRESIHAHIALIHQLVDARTDPKSRTSIEVAS